MTVRLSTGAVNGIAGALGFGGLFNRGSIEIRTGTQPVSADAAVSGTLLGIATHASGALTKETRATGTVVITGGSGSVATLTVGTFNIIPDGAVPYNTSTAQTASDLCDAINRNGIYEASVSGSTVTIRPRPGAGAAHNGLAVTSTGSVTATYGGGTISGGAAAANGLIWLPPNVGLIAKLPAQVLSFNGIAAGVAGWGRLVGSEADAGSGLSGAPWLPRMDFSIGVGSGDLQMGNVNIQVGQPNTIDQLSWRQLMQAVS